MKGARFWPNLCSHCKPLVSLLPHCEQNFSRSFLSLLILYLYNLIGYIQLEPHFVV
jgi:hypothetical protein